MSSLDAHKKKLLKWTEEETAAKSSLPVKKGPYARLLPNVGVPKILPDRKFPILRCVLKSCSHPNAVTVILLTLIAFLHPRSLSFILSRPSLPENTALYLQCGAGLCCFTADNMQASFWDCVFHWEAVADIEAYSVSHYGKRDEENNACSQWQARGFEVDC